MFTVCVALVYTHLELFSGVPALFSDSLCVIFNKIPDQLYRQMCVLNTIISSESTKTTVNTVVCCQMLHFHTNCAMQIVNGYGQALWWVNFLHWKIQAHF